MTMNFDYQKAATMNNILTRLESLEQSRAQSASAMDAVLNGINKQFVDVRSGCTEMRHDTTRLEKIIDGLRADDHDLRKTISMQGTAIESLELSRAAQANEIETLRKLILFQDTAIESLDAQYKRMALSQDDDRAARIRDRAEINNLFANFREAVAAQTEAMRKLVDAAPEFIRYVHAGDLQKIIDERVHVAIAGTQLVVTVKMEPR